MDLPPRPIRKTEMNSCNYHVSHFGTRMRCHASNPPPTPHPARSRPHSALRGGCAQHGTGSDSHSSAGGCVGKPPRPVRRGRHGERLVRRLEARRGRHRLRPHRQRLLLAGRGAQPGAVAHGHHPPVAVLFRRHADLLAQRRLALRAGKPAPFRTEFPLAGDQRPLWHLPLRFRRQDSRRQSRISSNCSAIDFRQRTDRPAHLRPLRR